MLHPDVFWAYRFFEVYKGLNSLVIPKTPQWLQLMVQKDLMFNAFGEEYLCLLKRVLFLSICRLYLIKLLREIYMVKVL